MRVFTLLFGILFWASFAAASDDPVCPVPGNWIFQREMSDEFDGDKLDAAKWFDFNPTFHGRAPGYFSRDNVAVADGFLRLTARELRPGELTVENDVRGFNKFTTATVKSKKRIRYGYYEARCKSMKAGVCNAFWLYDPLDPPKKYVEGNISEEIDIFEVFGKPAAQNAERTFFGTVHRMCTPYVEAIANRKQAPVTNKETKVKVDFDFWADFHVYGFLWTPTEMVWFLDGKEVWRRKNDHFHSALHVMLDCEIMKNWVGEPDPADLPAVFETDYVRIWQSE